MAALIKTSGSTGSALPDPVKDQTAIAPLPMPAIENKPAPGQTGPKGLSPRTTYSKVNTGSPPVMDAGAMGQKASPNRGMEFLPAKVAAQRGSTMTTTMHARPSLQDMVKQAMAGAASALSTNLEAARQETAQRGTTKTASVKVDTSEVSTEMVSKLAGALEFIEQQLRKEAEGPGEGPGSLTVMQASASETNMMDAGHSGEATSKNQPPMNPPLQPEKVQEGNAGTGLQTNDSMMHGEQPVEPIKNASAALNVLSRLGKAGTDKEASAAGKLMAARDSVKGALGAAKGFGAKAVGKGKELGAKAGDFAKSHPKSVGGAGLAAAAATGAGLKMTANRRNAYKSKEGSAPISFIRKLAEDAINPAHISSPASVNPAAPPPGAAPAGEQVPSEPSDVTSQKSMISSNEAAINYTKGQAKADPKKDVNQVLTEPALSSAHDKVLNEVFENTGRAGVKISSAKEPMKKTATQVAAQRVTLNALLKQASADVKATATKGQ